jgi:hypothetical protein
MHGDRDLAQLPVVPASHKKDVKAFLQIAPLVVETSGPELQAQSLSCRNACSDHLTFFGLRSHLGNGNFLAPYAYRTANLSLKLLLVCNANYLQNLARPKVIVNDWLTVTNWVPPVNDALGQSPVTEDGVTRASLGELLRYWGDLGFRMRHFEQTRSGS